jgi:hypothetical protein
MILKRCVGAGCASLLFMRYNEIRDGVDVKDEDGKIHGRSSVSVSLSLFNDGVKSMILTL